MTVAHTPLVTLVGWTHASRVMPDERSSADVSGIVADELVPLKDNAPPVWPLAQLVLSSVAISPLPLESRAVEPERSSNENAATRPVEAPAAFCAPWVVAD